MKKIWFCKIGETDESNLPKGADFPMRQAIHAAYEAMTGRPAEFCFSGWGGTLDETERAVVEDRQPSIESFERDRLLKFYGVSDDTSLIAAMLEHIEKLQSKLPRTNQPAVIRPREG